MYDTDHYESAEVVAQIAEVDNDYGIDWDCKICSEKKTAQHQSARPSLMLEGRVILKRP